MASDLALDPATEPAIDAATDPAIGEALAVIRPKVSGWLGTVPKNPGFTSRGKVSQVLGTLIEAHMPPVQIGELCHLLDPAKE
ncbi:MAG TPA: hypothetical protein VJ577_17965, partial [Burkholderiaceae bacterium]|nr:hypothetical protein [Burkholderiaceae bacterium]